VGFVNDWKISEEKKRRIRKRKWIASGWVSCSRPVVEGTGEEKMREKREREDV